MNSYHNENKSKHQEKTRLGHQGPAVLLALQLGPS
jgi:hypothetical protein